MWFPRVMQMQAGGTVWIGLIIVPFVIITASPHTSLMTCPALAEVQNADSLETMLSKIEKLAVEVGRDVKTMLANRCDAMKNCECSRNMCSDNVENYECSAHVARAAVCGDGGCSASPMDFAATAVHSTSSVNGPLEKEFVCGLTGLDATLVEAWKKHEGLIWIYFGSFNGVFRSYPGHLWDCARRYDNRIRPWYRSASSGLKDVVIVVDVSGSMVQSNRLELVRKALTGDEEKKGLLDMLTHNDYISIVSFSDASKTLSELTRATIENIGKLKETVAGMLEDSRTNFMSGLKAGFDVLIEGHEKERTSDCKKVMVFLTDGEDSFCGKLCADSHPMAGIEMRDAHGACRCAESYLDTISSYQEELRSKTGHEASIFTYSMGIDADDNIPRQIACRNGGSWASIRDGDDPLTQMASFFHFLAQSVENEVVYWTEPYLGFSTGAMQTTAATPVFESSEFKTLLGVVGVDLHLEQLHDKFADYESLLRTLQARSKRCSTEKPSHCQMQVKRLNRADDSSVVDASCPAVVPRSRCCYRVGAERSVVLVREAMTWTDAEQYCAVRFRGGRLVSLSRLGVRVDHQELHVLGGVAPPDGAWVGLRESDGWEWTDGSAQAETDDKLWSHVPIDAPCAFIDPRGSVSNVAVAPCNTAKSFICETSACEDANGTSLCGAGEAPYDFATDSGPDKVLPPEQCQEELESFVKQCEGDSAAGAQEFCEPHSTDDWATVRAHKGWCCNLAGPHFFSATSRLEGVTAAAFSAAEGAFKAAVSSLLHLHNADRVKVGEVTGTARRAAAATVEYEVTGYHSEEEAGAGASELQRLSDEGRMRAALVDADVAFAGLVAVSTEAGEDNNNAIIIAVAVVVPLVVCALAGAWLFVRRSRKQAVKRLNRPPAQNPEAPCQSAPPMPTYQVVQVGSVQF